MMLLFNIALLVLNTVRKVFAFRAGRLERRCVRLAREVHALSRKPLCKEGNSTRYDPLQVAKQQYLLGAFVQKTDRLEAAHFAWAQRAEKMGQAAARLQQWKGRLLPYAFGALDALGAACLIDYVTVGDCVRLKQLIATVTAWFSA